MRAVLTEMVTGTAPPARLVAEGMKKAGRLHRNVVIVGVRFGRTHASKAHLQVSELLYRFLRRSSRAGGHNSSRIGGKETPARGRGGTRQRLNL